MRIRFHHWWFKFPPGIGSAGFVFYPWVMFKRRPNDVSDRLFRHELEHAYQVQREGWLKFYLTYLLYLVRYGYRNNPYEVEARAVADDPFTEEERKIREDAEAAYYKNR